MTHKRERGMTLSVKTFFLSEAEREEREKTGNRKMGMLEANRSKNSIEQKRGRER